ncbi:homeodomain-like domain-containing protein [Ditylenchus destructor]|uniref:Homeodomain-like domain-containing protein n=1 Tax=Ditylenchus destructor TaxID=166010 RepID=A0AAD4MLE0_9BILA|nr:homeodomain-like domain-containing protein [Ditylenchus destructor]
MTSSDDEIRILPTLRRKWRKTLTKEERQIIINQSEAGQSARQIGAILKCSGTTVCKFLKHYRETESIERQKRKRPAPKITPDMEAMLEQKLKETPTYTAKQGAIDLKAAFGVNVHPETVRHAFLLSRKKRVISMDSDDEIMIVTTPKRPRAQNSGSKVGTKNLTAPQKLAIVRANEQGTKKSDIAKIFDTSINTVYRVLDEYRSAETAIAVKKKFGVQIGIGSVRRIRNKNGLYVRRLND